MPHATVDRTAGQPALLLQTDRGAPINSDQWISTLEDYVFPKIGEALVEVLQHRDQYVKPRAFIEQTFSFKDTVDGYERVFREYAHR